MTRRGLYWMAALLAILVVLGAALASTLAGGGTVSVSFTTPPAALPSPSPPTGEVLPGPTASPRPPARPTPTVGSEDLEALARAFPLERALDHLRVLTSPEMDGRRAGTPGERRAAMYLASELQASGIAPLLSEGYFQTFPLTFLDLGAEPQLVRLAPGQLALEHRRDFREHVFALAGGGTAEGPLVVAGYGGAGSPFPSAGELGGRPVLALTGGRAPLDRVLSQAVEAGAGALLLGSLDPRGMDVKFSYIPPLDPRAIPVLTASPEALDRLLQPAGLQMDELAERARGSAGPFLLETDLQVRVSLPLVVEQRESRNVLGLLPGAHPERAEEYFILGGHYDHVGRDPDGTLYAGANDNASGTAVTLAVAQHWRLNGFRPERSVIFAFWGAEEAGLVGSQHFVAHPPVPLEQISGFLNLDAVGQADGDRLVVEGGAAARELAGVVAQAARDLDISLTTSLRGGGGSDHQPFNEHGVPAVLLIWEGFSSWIHVPRDTFENISAEKVLRVGQLAGLVSSRLAGLR